MNVAAVAVGLLTLADGAAFAQISAHDSGLLLQEMATRPTYGSELRRGAKAGFGCRDIDVADRELKRCFDDAMHLNIISNTQGERPFELGVYMNAFVIELIKLDTKVDLDIREHGEIDANVKFYFVEYVTIRKELGLTDEEVIAALGLSPSVGTDLRRYETHPELLAPLWKEP